jgi:Cof subfamily protein (haloacid dehalogenase superfamily)
MGMKLVAIDMDGTLLNNHRTISRANEQAIRQAQEQGIKVVIATGRSYKEALPVLQEASIICPMICVNGAEIRSESGARLLSIPMEMDLFQFVDHTLSEYQLYYELYTDQGTFTNDRKKAISVAIDFLRTARPDLSDSELVDIAQRRFRNGQVIYTSNYEEMLQAEGTEVYKFLTFSSEREQLIAARDKLNQNDELAISASAHFNLEITKKEAQKGMAVSRVARYFGISLEETMAIGDNFNDLSMIEKVGYGVAMGNAEEEIKRIARFVTKTNDEDGVAFAIQKLAIAKEESL